MTPAAPTIMARCADFASNVCPTAIAIRIPNPTPSITSRSLDQHDKHKEGKR
jgi:hypothetical protein